MTPIEERVIQITNAESISGREEVQQLWGGYGHLLRFQLEGAKVPSVIVKHVEVTPPPPSAHPRGWGSTLSHQRKLKSYQVETNWYKNWLTTLDPFCRTPVLYDSFQGQKEILLIMEDLDASGFHRRVHHYEVTLDQMKACLKWLANFHIKCLGKVPQGLWETGTYWHLDTRPEEWEVMQNQDLKAAAKEIDARLNQARYLTIVHGDAKLANFCFGEKGEVAAVDFQYVGQGCGMKDVAYFLSSCMQSEAYRQGDYLLDYYFDELERAVKTYKKSIDFSALKEEWLRLYPYAWADFCRFLDGWSPGHWKMNQHVKEITNRVLLDIKQKNNA